MRKDIYELPIVNDFFKAFYGADTKADFKFAKAARLIDEGYQNGTYDFEDCELLWAVLVNMGLISDFMTNQDTLETLNFTGGVPVWIEDAKKESKRKYIEEQEEIESEMEEADLSILNKVFDYVLKSDDNVIFQHTFEDEWDDITAYPVGDKSEGVEFARNFIRGVIAETIYFPGIIFVVGKGNDGVREISGFISDEESMARISPSAMRQILRSMDFLAEALFETETVKYRCVMPKIKGMPVYN